jgi:hypothetical protein
MYEGGLMRNKRYLVGALALAISMLFASSALAITNVTQTVDGVLGGKEKPKFDKKKFKKTSVKVTTTTADADNPSGMPPKANTAIITFDKKDVKFDSKAVPGCDPNAIENTTTDAARAACGDSEVGQGSAQAALPFGVGGTRQDFGANVVAFNRSDAKGILLHSRVDALGTTVVLKGTLNGVVLTVDIPPLGGGVGAIAEFDTFVKAGKYIQGRCKDKKINYTGEFRFNDAPTAVAQDEQRCKQKKKK